MSRKIPKKRKKKKNSHLFTLLHNSIFLSKEKTPVLKIETVINVFLIGIWDLGFRL